MGKEEVRVTEITVNGKYYPMWQGIIDKKERFIGRKLIDKGDSFERLMGSKAMETPIVDISLKPNGEDSAFFTVHGIDFNCGFDVQVGGIVAGDEGYLTFSGYGGHVFMIESL